MKLTTPTDFKILEEMADGKRQTPGNLADLIDIDNTYASGRVQHLLDHDLVERVNPNLRHGGMYVITNRGRVAVEHWREYDKELRRAFGDCVDRVVTINEAFQEFHPDAVAPVEAEMDYLDELKSDPLTYPDDFESSNFTIMQNLYRLHFFRLASRNELTFSINDRGERALELWGENTAEWDREKSIELNRELWEMADET